MEKVISNTDFFNKASDKEKSFLLLYKSGSEQRDCSFRNLEEALKGEQDLPVYLAD
jgi:hypothetical protein